MNRRELFQLSTAAALAAALPAAVQASPLRPPATGPIVVAFLLSRDAVVIDFAGPWEVFDNVAMPGTPNTNAFQLYTVAESRDPFKATGGMTIVPDHTFATAPQPHVIVIPAQSRHTDPVLAWIRQASASADLTMSVCNGVFLLAKTGLLAGKSATAHHSAYGALAMEFPDIKVMRGVRFVEAGKVASSGGLSSGIDLALRVVERYFGRATATNTAYALEYQGLGWRNPQSNNVYAQRPHSTDAHPLCPVCDMAVDKAGALSSVYRRRTYYFCMEAHQHSFAAHPAAFLAG